METFFNWFWVLVYLVPILGALIQLLRKLSSLWSLGSFLKRRVSRKYSLPPHFFNFNRYLNVQALNLLSGRFEYLIGHLRDYTIGMGMTFMGAVSLTLILLGGPEKMADRFESFLYYAFFASLSLYSYRRHVATGLKMTEFLRCHPLIHPQEWYEHYYRRIGFLTISIPRVATTLMNPADVDFSTGRPPRQSYWLLLRAFYDTAILARSAQKALDVIGWDYGRDVFDVVAAFWGARSLQLFRARMKISGWEKLNGLDGKVILAFNHKSHLDFVLAFYALSQVCLASGRRLRLRYMIAKDHFVDNPIVYEGIGIGRVVEAGDMIFVDRKGKGVQAIDQAVQTLKDKNVDIAIFPQGTRAFGNTGARGERLDAGYYTTGTFNSLKRERGYLKKGTGYLALDTALSMASENIPVHVVCIGIEGTATIIPKMVIKPQTEVSVHLQVGQVLTLNAGDVAGLRKPLAGMALHTPEEEAYIQKLDALQAQIDQALREALNLHNKLAKRFLEDLKTMDIVPADQFLAIKGRLFQLEKEGVLSPFIILDRIYASQYTYWRDFLKALALELCGVPDLSQLDVLCDKVTEVLFQTRGKEMARIGMSEQNKQSRRAS